MSSRRENKQSREDRLRNVQSLCASIQSEQRKRTVPQRGVTMATAAKKGKGQRSTYKIKLGWKNFRDGEYRVVTKAKGGESRMMSYAFGESLTVEGIRNQALDYFFPDGVSNVGSVEEYDFSLALASGKVIDSFVDKNKDPCNFSEYLTANGLYASQCHIYLRSKKKEKTCFVINGERGDRTINIKYSKVKQSLYSEEQSVLSCRSTLQCFDVSGSPEKDSYDPFEDGFLVSRIEVQNTVFLERDENVYNCPVASPPGQFILNGPNEIFGLEVDDSNSLVLGAITMAHNQNYIYKWLRNGNVFCSGMNHCVVKVTEPGSYHVVVENSNDSSTLGMSETVQVDVIPSTKNKGPIHSLVASQVVDPQLAHVTTRSQAASQVGDPQLTHVTTHPQAVSPANDPQLTHVTTHSQAASQVGDPQLPHVATHSQGVSQVGDPQLTHVTTHPQAVSPVVDPQLTHVTTHPQAVRQVGDPQLPHVATHSQASSQVGDPQLTQVTTHSQGVCPVSDPQLTHVTTHLQAVSPVNDPQLTHVTTHAQAASQVCDPQLTHVTSHPQAVSPVSDPQLTHVTTHSQAISQVVDPLLTHVATHSQTVSPVSDPQLTHVTTHSLTVSPVSDPQLTHVTTHVQAVSPVNDPQLTHVTTHSQGVSQVGDPQLTHVTTHPQAVSPVVDPQLTHVTTHPQAVSQVGDPQLPHVATHSQASSQVGDPLLTHVATHSQTVSPVSDPQLTHVTTHSLTVSPVSDPQLTHVTTHVQAVSPVNDPQLTHVATHSQTVSPVSDPQLTHVTTHSLTVSPVSDPQLTHVTTHVQAVSPVNDPQLTHVTTHSQAVSQVGDPQLPHVTTRSQAASQVVDPHLTHVATHSQGVSQVGDPQLTHVTTHSQVASPFVRPKIASVASNSTSNFNCVPLIPLTDIAFGRELGKGGFGTVFEGEWLKSKVAVKVISVKRLKLIKHNLLREITLHSQLRHPNIVLLMAYALENSKLYLVTELVEGDSLDEVLFGDKNKSLMLSERLAIAEKICLAVVYLHSQTPVVVHRDIKPDNILISHDLKQVKLCDMGLSKIKTMNTVMTTMAGGSVQPGTPVYQAPEILVDRKSANIASDIWSLSCTLVELVGDCPIWNMPEDFDNPVQYIIEKMNGNAKPDGLHGLRSVSDNVYSVLERGLSYKTTDRPQASEIVDCLRNLIRT